MKTKLNIRSYVLKPHEALTEGGKKMLSFNDHSDFNYGDPGTPCMNETNCNNNLEGAVLRIEDTKHPLCYSAPHVTWQ